MTLGAQLDARGSHPDLCDLVAVAHGDRTASSATPKGINNNHFKLLVIGIRVSSQLELGTDSVGYARMPLFHSNAMLQGFQPAFHAGGTMAPRERFSASRFVPDVLEYGVTYWSYVGEPVHYILGT